MLTVLLFSSAAASTVMIGLGAEKSRRTMRDPVTVISSRGACAAAPEITRIEKDETASANLLDAIRLSPLNRVTEKSARVVIS